MALYLVFCKTEAPSVSASSCRNFFLRYDKSDSAKSEPQNAASPDTESPSLRSVKFDTRSRIPFSRLPIVPAIKIMRNIETRRRNRGILDEGEEKREGREGCLDFYSSRMFEMAQPEVVLCQNMPIPSTGISFMAGRSLRHGNPSGPRSTRIEET